MSIRSVFHWTTCFVVGYALCCGSSAEGKDFKKPGWRGNPLSRTLEWDFSQGTLPDPVPTNVYIPPSQSTSESDGVHELSDHPDDETNKDVMQYRPDQFEWLPSAGYIYNYTNDTKFLDFRLLNFVDDFLLKDIRIQIHHGDSDPVPYVQLVSWSEYNQTTGQIINSGTVEKNHGRRDGGSQQVNGLWETWEDWRIFPNPDYEGVTLAVPAGTFVYQVVIDTISVPEPSTLLLSFAAICIPFRRRR